MAIPWNIRGSASQLFYQDKSSSQCQALLAISGVPHPDRSVLGAFVNDAFDPQAAARYFLQTTSTEDVSKEPKKTVPQFLAAWKVLIEKFRPTPTISISSETKMLIYDRDGGYCCLTRTPFKSYQDHGLEYVHIVPPCVFTDPDLSEGTFLLELLRNFLPRELLGAVCDPRRQEIERLDNLWLLSTLAFDAVKKGEVFLRTQSWGDHSDTTRKQPYTVGTNFFKPQNPACFPLLKRETLVENRTPQLTLIPNEQLLGIHARFSKPLAWIETKKYMDSSLHGARNKPPGRYHRLIQHILERNCFLPSLVSPFFPLFQKCWKTLPSSIRASVYDGLRWIGLRLYGGPLSDTVFKLPFGLILRRGSPTLVPKFHAETHTLQMVERSTSIPVPRAIDVLETPRFGYMLMTCVPGHPIGQMLDSMSDEQVKQAVVDLKRYVSELRQIPSNNTEFRICNSQGSGILDWRLADSQREELRFKSEADFNKYLTDPFWEDIRRRAAKSHNIQHQIVFTHADLNPGNILADNGRITGIVDWENAGWFPEYWEYTKAHFSVRGFQRWLADVIDEVFEGYRDELLVENMLSDLSGPF
ncbi:kinase-like protein [Aspergillus sclerotioniger CBS 115572]|uniref:Kinase-like protein n=1 Tax=Aspergillus sclerotioniger CBS 115572 TaxID=1450535 RepID=A0A317W5C1_9EURO|nr:kinase-like protein [Aspergillus sclerotioniger CBS 115572]PWY80248.1 kinase-like protein [Aspergillus sclerotioniger CBS 115572]